MLLTRSDSTGGQTDCASRSSGSTLKRNLGVRASSADECRTSRVAGARRVNPNYVLKAERPTGRR